MPDWVNDLDASAWIALGAVLVALASFPLVWWSARSASRSADAAQGQTEQQRQIHEDTAQPYVWAGIVPDEKQGFLLKLVVANEGPTVATDIKVVFDPQPVPTHEPEDFAGVLSKLESGLGSLPPGQRIEWLFDTAPNFFGTEAELVTQVTVDCKGPHGWCPTNSYMVRLADVEGMMDWPAGTLHLVEQRLKELTKVFKDRDQRERMAEVATRRVARQEANGDAPADVTNETPV